MTTPTPPNDETWSAFMGTHGPTGDRIVKDGPEPWRFGTPPNVAVDPDCPRCHRADHWRLLQVLGETPGIPEMPAQGSGVAMRCGLCGFTRRYRERPATAAEVAERTAKLAKAALRP